MNVSIWVAWIVVAIFSVLSVVFLSGKGSFLIAGYNTQSKEQKQRYNPKRLCRILGSGFSVITIILGISVFYRFELPAAISWLVPWGVISTLAVMIILANTVCKAK